MAGTSFYRLVRQGGSVVILNGQWEATLHVCQRLTHGHFLTLICRNQQNFSTVNLGNKERLDKEQICVKEPFSVTNLPFTS